MTFSDLSDCSMEAGPSSGQCCCSFLPNGASSAPERARNQRNARMGDAQVQTVQRHWLKVSGLPLGGCIIGWFDDT